MIHPLHNLACWVRRKRTIRRVGCDPVPYFAEGRYYLGIGTRGWITEHEYELGRDGMERLAKVIPALLKTADEEAD